MCSVYCLVLSTPVTVKYAGRSSAACSVQCAVREILIFEGAIFSLWNHPFYCSVRRADFKNVFVFKIGPILVVRIKI